MEIKRDAYLEQLKIRKDNGMIKIITGIRRCGKSFLLFVLFKKYLLERWHLPVVVLSQFLSFFISPYVTYIQKYRIISRKSQSFRA